MRADVVAANIAETLLHGPNRCDDSRPLAHLLFKVMEPGSSMADPQTLQLRNPQKWSECIKAFLERASKGSLTNLSQVGSPSFRKQLSAN
jgi:hypothetical protein